MAYLLFAVALGLSSVAAYYSIMGLVAIFAAAAIPIFIMGSLLEISKLVVASWLYRSWKEIPKLMMVYFTAALFVLMMLTSMGIFGYLSKAHLDQAVPTGDIAAKLSLYDEKIKTEKENINANRATLNQLDQQVNQTLSRTTDAGGADRSVGLRRTQAKERQTLLQQIEASQAKISKLNEERAPIAAEVRKVEAEVGPIKYIAQLIYGQEAQEPDFLEKAVRIVILMIVSVFDPLAVLLLIAANWQIRKDRYGIPVKKNYSWDEFFKKKETKPDVPDVVPEPIIEEDDYLDIALEEEPTVEDEVIVDPPKKDWEPELYERVEEPVKKLGRYESELLAKEQGMKPKNKANSFLERMRTIEQDVEELQKNETRM